MKIVTVFFERKKQYNKLLTVFKNSARKIMPGVHLNILKIKMPENIDHKRDTAFAFIAAAEFALKQNECIAIADVDLMFIKPINDIWKMKFDIAITTRNKTKPSRYNTGVWFYRPSKRSRHFLKNWITRTKRLMKQFDEKEDFIWSFGGIDQASLYLTLKYNDIADIKEIPCLEWNATQSEWKYINDKTRVIHIKSKLRLAVFDKIDLTEEYKYMIPLIKKWRSYL